MLTRLRAPTLYVMANKFSTQKFKRLIRSRHARVVGSDDGGSTWLVAGKVIAWDVVNDYCRQLTGKQALYTAYQYRQRHS